MQDYIYYIHKNGEFKKLSYNEVIEIMDKDSILIKTISSYMGLVYLYKKQNDIKWKVILKFDDFIDFILKNQNNIILYTFQPKNIEHITKAIHERNETIENKDEPSKTKEYYSTNNLFIATISYNNDILSQKFILELENNEYREVFSGIPINNDSTNNYQFNIIEITPLGTYTEKAKLSKSELLLLQNKINSKQTKKRYIRRKNSLT